MKKVKVFEREIMIPDEDINWLLDNDQRAFLENDDIFEWYLEQFLRENMEVKDEREFQENIINEMNKYADAELAENIIRTWKKDIEESIASRGPVHIRKDLLAQALSRDDVFGTKPFAPFALNEKELDWLFDDYYICHQTIYSCWWIFKIPEENDRCGLAAYYNRKDEYCGGFDDEFYYNWTEEEEIGREPLEDILRLDVMKSEFCAKDRLWIGGSKEEVIIYFYGRDSHEHDTKLVLKRRSNAEDNWDPSSLWTKMDEKARYHYHRDGDDFILECKERRMVFSNPRIECDDDDYYFMQSMEEGDFYYDLRFESKLLEGEEWQEKKKFEYIGDYHRRFLDFRTFLKYMLYVPARISGNVSTYGEDEDEIFQWTESTRSLDCLKGRSAANDVYEITKREKTDGTTRFDIVFSEYNGDGDYGRYEEDYDMWQCWYEQGAGESYGVFGLCLSDMLELLKCIDAFIDHAWEEAVEKYQQYVLEPKGTNGEEPRGSGYDFENGDPQPGELWKIVFRVWNSTDFDLPWDKRWEEENTFTREWREQIVEKMENAGFSSERMNVFVGYDRRGMRFSELKKMLVELTDDPWYRENLSCIGIIRICDDKAGKESTDDTGDAEYEVPEEILAKIPGYFYEAMAGELFAAVGYEKGIYIMRMRNDTGGEDDEYADLWSGSAAWDVAFYMTCRKLDMMWLWEYQKALEWYEYDVFAGKIEYLTGEYFIRGKGLGKAYYTYLSEEKKKNG